VHVLRCFQRQLHALREAVESSEQEILMLRTRLTESDRLSEERAQDLRECRSRLEVCHPLQFAQLPTHLLSHIVAHSGVCMCVFT
jgi:hypothetical protein